MSGKKIFSPIAILLLISAAIRIVLAYTFPLGNDEAYYYTYAKYPDWSHFDHPSMVGWVIQLFSLNLLFTDELFIRLAAIVAGTVNTWLMYKLGKLIGDELTGWYTALLYTASLYGFVIVGVFILPDSPQTSFWLTALLLLLNAFKNPIPDPSNKRFFLLASVFIGLAMLSKYSTVFLWFGMVSFIILYKHKWLRTYQFYVSQIIILLIFSPVLIWNYKNNFISFTFHGNRVEVNNWIPDPDKFGTAFLGEFLYTNPVLWVLILYAIVIYLKREKLSKSNPLHLLLFTGVPIIVVFWVISFYRSTLPHWSGSGFLTLLPILALLLRKKHSKRVPLPIVASLSFIGLILLVVPLQILTGFIPLQKIGKTSGIETGNDYSLEMVGWHTLQKEFPILATRYEENGLMLPGSPIVSYRWFPAANFEYYAARRDNRAVLAAGDTSEIHGYAWINQNRGGFNLNTDAYYITSSREYRNPKTLRSVYYEKILPPDTIPVYRMKKQVFQFYVYRLKNLQYKAL